MMRSPLPWGRHRPIVVRYDPANGEMITAHDGSVHILMTFFGADVIRQRSKIRAAVEQAAAHSLDDKYLAKVIETANAAVRAARPLGSNQGASIAIACLNPKDNKQLQLISLGDCQVWIVQDNALESVPSHAHSYLGEFGLNISHLASPKNHRLDLDQKQYVALAPAHYDRKKLLATRPAWPVWLGLLLSIVMVGFWGRANWGGEIIVTPTPLTPTLTSTTVPTPLTTPTTTPTRVLPTNTPTPTSTLTTPRNALQVAPRASSMAPTPTASRSPTQTPTLAPTLEPKATLDRDAVRDIELAIYSPVNGASDPVLTFNWEVLSGGLSDPYMFEVIIWQIEEDDPGREPECFVSERRHCGRGIAAPQKGPPSPQNLSELSQMEGLREYLVPGKRYKWTVFVVVPEDRDTPEVEYRRIGPVTLRNCLKSPHFRVQGAILPPIPPSNRPDHC